MPWSLPRALVFGALVGVLGCAPLYDDGGAAEPASWWPWVCSDGGVAPDAGCPPPPACQSEDAAAAGEDGGC
jgi:hypothetical protein